MYHLQGKEFSELIKRSFADNHATTEASVEIKGKFKSHTKNVRDENFDILYFSSKFEEAVTVNALSDISHVSLHFQLAGSSNAKISGINSDLSMKKGHYHLMNCVEPVSSFVFPRQQQYEYCCIGLKPSFFNSILLECGSDYDDIVKKNERRLPFSLYEQNRITDHLQQDILRLLLQPPLADSLKTPYLRSKVREITLLTIGHYPVKKIREKKITAADKNSLHEVKEYLSRNYLSELTLEGISRDFLLNEFKLKSGFKMLFGMTVFGYVQKLRMEHAYTLLTSGGFTSSEVAAVVGYQSDAAFIRAFKLHYGRTPGSL